MRIIEICDYPPEFLDDIEHYRENTQRCFTEESNSTCLCAIERTIGLDGKVTIELFEIPAAPSASETEDVRWYLEDYVSRDPFQSGRAARALGLLQAHGRQLINSIPWAQFFQPSESIESLFIQVQLKDETLSGHILWELLEHTDLWEEFAPERVFVSRRRRGVLDGTPDHDEESPTALNMLVVVARPRAEADIPHRLVTRAIMDVTAELSSPSPYTVSVEIVRPGTFSALRAHLQQRPKGYFQYVHLDVHGSEDASGSVYLDFLADADKDDFQRIERDPVKADVLAKELELHGIHYGVLNACRSAKQGQIGANVALRMLDAGLWGCVAMSYSVVSRSVEIFTQVFYEALLLKRVSFECAASYGRAVLKIKSTRLSKFGQPIELDDSMVPLVYMNGVKPWRMCHQLQSPLTLPEDVSTAPNCVFGREADILRLESALLVGKRPLLLTGEAAVGKTYLMRHISSWWKETGLIEDALILSLSQDLVWDAEKMYVDIHLLLCKNDPYPGREATLKKLKQSRLLLIMDGLESMVRPGYSTPRKQRQEIFHLLRNMSGGICLVVLISRARETWLGGSVWTEAILGLAVGHAVELFDNMVTVYRDKSIFSTAAENMPEDKDYVELLVKIVDCHPLAVQQIAWNYCRSLKNPRAFLMDLLAGEPMEIAKYALGDDEGYRSIEEIECLIEQARPKHFLDGPDPTMFAAFWRRFPVADAFSISFFFAKAAQRQFGLNGPQGLQSTLNTINMIRQVNPDLAPSLGEDLEARLREASALKKTPDVYSEIDTLYLIMEDLNLEEIGDFPGRNIAELGCRRFVDTFRSSLYLHGLDPDAHSPRMVVEQYLRIHPLLPILLRADEVYRTGMFEYRKIVRQGFLLYYAYRSKKFPHQYQWYNPVWDEIREELHSDFFNYASANVMYMRTPGMDYMQQSVVLRMLFSLHRGTLRDPSRFKVVATLTEAMVEILIMQEADLMKKTALSIGRILQNSVQPFMNVVSSIFGPSGSVTRPLAQGRPASSMNKSEKEKLLLEVSPEVMLFTTRTYISGFCPALIQHYHHLNSSRQIEFLQLAERTIEALTRTGPPPELVSEWNFIQQSQHYNLVNCRVSANPGGVDPEEFFKYRQEYHHWLTNHYGVETVPASQVDMYSLPIENMGASSHMIRMFRIIPKVRTAIDEERFAQARTLIDDALIEEINFMSNDEVNKATLLRYRSEVDEKEGNWEDALKHYEEALAMEAMAANAQGGEIKILPVQEYRRRHREMLMDRAREAKALS